MKQRWIYRWPSWSWSLFFAAGCVQPAQAPAPQPAAAQPTDKPADQPAAPAGKASTELNLLCTPQEEWCQGMKQEFEAKYSVTVN